MNILVLGSGGREHALALKISQSPKTAKLFVAPGNAGTAEIATNVEVGVNDFSAIKQLVLKEQIDLVVVGPEDPLVNGVHDFFLNDAELAQIAQSDMLFFSGIALGVIEEPSRELFWRKLEKLKAQGVTLVFDPNYRASMWQNPEEAAQSFHRAFQLADIAMPGVEDLEVLFQVNSAQQVMAFCQQYELKEIVVKNGPQSVLTFDGESLLNHVITPVKNVVDTTSAGDAFDGVYLGSRLSGKSISEAVSFAAKAAGIVIQFPGAIAPAEAFQQAMSQAS